MPCSRAQSSSARTCPSASSAFSPSSGSTASRNHFAERLSRPPHGSLIDRHAIHAVYKPVELGVLQHEGPISLHHNRNCGPAIGGQLLCEPCFKLPQSISGNLRQKVFFVAKVFIQQRRRIAKLLRNRADRHRLPSFAHAYRAGRCQNLLPPGDGTPLAASHACLNGFQAPSSSSRRQFMPRSVDSTAVCNGVCGSFPMKRTSRVLSSSMGWRHSGRVA